MEDLIVKLSSFIKCNYEPNSLICNFSMYKRKKNLVTNKIKNKIITINDNNFFNNKTVLSYLIIIIIYYYYHYYYLLSLLLLALIVG